MAKETMKVLEMEKQVTEDNMDALPPVQVMAGGEAQDPLILVDGHVNMDTCIHRWLYKDMNDAHGQTPPLIKVEGSGGVAAKLNLGLKNWRLPYWLIAGSVIIMTNNIHATPKLILAELAMFSLFLCGTGLVFLVMKEKMK